MSRLLPRQGKHAAPAGLRSHSCRRGARLAVIAAALVAVSANTVSAQWSRQHASTCLPVDTPAGEFYVASTPGVGNTSANTDLLLTCPSFDTSEQPDSAVQQVSVFVYDGSSTAGVSVRACATARNGTNLSCSDAVQTGAAFTGYATLTLNAQALTEWDGNGFSYVSVRLPPRVGLLGLSWVKGIVATEAGGAVGSVRAVP
ncbi:MAG TPA: hypothetical protein VIL35_08610 [Vicinamibacterales bacterium]